MKILFPVSRCATLRMFQFLDEEVERVSRLVDDQFAHQLLHELVDVLAFQFFLEVDYVLGLLALVHYLIM